MIEKAFSRGCPNCGRDLLYTTKKHRDLAEKKNSVCRPCSIQKMITKPKEEFICYTYGKVWMDWRSQISKPETPFCSKQCWYNSETKSLVGQTFDKLQVETRERRNQTTFYNCNCKCECGKITEVTHANLVSGNVSSCGCLVVERRRRERKPVKDVITKAILASYKRNAKNRNYEWKLSDDKFAELIHSNCYYCKSEPSNLFTWRYKYETATMPFNGIDRLDNTIGYTIDNCVSCCRTCNSAKGELSIQEFQEWVTKLITNFPRYMQQESAAY